VGDGEAFAQRSEFVMPFSEALLCVPDELLAYERRVFNYRISQARRVVENTFGILAARWRIFHRKIEAHPDTACKFVEACVCLHNFLMKTKEVSGVRVPAAYFGDVYSKGEMSVPGAWRTVADGSEMKDLPIRSCRNPRVNTRAQLDMLAKYAKYLTHDFAVEWQDNYVNCDRAVETI
jgi:DDE superfamily endonuclease